MSTPMAFWFEVDVWDYIRKYNLQYSKIYDMIFKNRLYVLYVRTALKQSSRFDRMKITHPQIYKYCMEKLGLRRLFGIVV